MPGERFAHSWEERFALTQVYGPMLVNLIRSVLDKGKAAAADLAKIVIDAPNPRAIDEAVRALKLDPARIADPFAATIGQAGAAHAGLMLAWRSPCCETGRPDPGRRRGRRRRRAAPARHAGCCDYRPRRSVGGMIESKGDVSYASYLKWREILPTEPPRRPYSQRPAGPPMFRAERWKFGLVGSRCTACGTPQLPPQRVCVKCRERDKMEPYPFADRSARIATFAIDRLAYSLNPPTVNVVIDYEGGGRFLCEMTDCEPERIAIGDEIEMAFRRLFTADGVHNYFWKARPRR